jgi:hypothetical protein
VTSLKTKELRRQYIDGLHDVLPQAGHYQSAAVPMAPIKRPTPKPAPKPKQPPVAPPPNNLFVGVALTNLGTRVTGILREMQSLDVDKYPNAMAALLRVLIELSVAQVYESKNWRPQHEFKARVQHCLAQVDPTGKAAKYRGVRAGLSDGTSILAAATMHAYLHNPHFHPTATDLRALAANYKDFLIGLDALV